MIILDVDIMLVLDYVLKPQHHQKMDIGLTNPQNVYVLFPLLSLLLKVKTKYLMKSFLNYVFKPKIKMVKIKLSEIPKKRLLKMLISFPIALFLYLLFVIIILVNVLDNSDWVDSTFSKYTSWLGK